MPAPSWVFLSLCLGGEMLGRRLKPIIIPRHQANTRPLASVSYPHTLLKKMSRISNDHQTIISNTHLLPFFPFIKCVVYIVQNQGVNERSK